MADNELLNLVQSKANTWLNSSIDSNSKKEIENLIKNDEAELVESFYKDLEFFFDCKL